MGRQVDIRYLPENVESTRRSRVVCKRSQPHKTARFVDGCGRRKMRGQAQNGAARGFAARFALWRGLSVI